MAPGEVQVRDNDQFLCCGVVKGWDRLREVEGSASLEVFNSSRWGAEGQGLVVTIGLCCGEGLFQPDQFHASL